MATWLSFRLGAPGLPGPFLRESIAPYQQIDLPNDHHQQVVVAIGNCHKSRFLQTFLSIPSPTEVGCVTLHALPREYKGICIDCELHTNHPTSRVDGGPQPGNYALHDLNQQNPDTGQLAYDIYHGVLSHFATVMLLFVDDLGGILGTAELLSNWLRLSMSKPGATAPMVALLSEQSLPPATELKLLVSTMLLQRLQVWEPTTPFTRRQTDKLLDNSFTLRVLLTRETCSTRSSFTHILKEGSAEKQRQGLSFYGRELKYLLREAIQHFSRHATIPFNIYHAATSTNRLPSSICERLLTSLKTCENPSNAAAIVASALAFNTYVHNTAGFLPAVLFRELYSSHVQSLEKTIKIPGLHDSVKTKFIEAARFRQEPNRLIGNHVNLVRRSLCRSSCKESCIVCLLRTPEHSLSCGHRLCARCVITLGRSVDHLRYKVSLCPACSSVDGQILAVRPATAGLRVLIIGGMGPDNIWSFLKAIRDALSLTSIPFRDHFDGILARDMGIFFALTLFIEGWSTSECKYHLPSLKEPKFTKKGTVVFGKKLEWSLRNVQLLNHIGIIIEGKNKLYSNIISTEKLCETRESSWMSTKQDICIRYGGGAYNDVLLRSIYGKLISTLFYIELVEIPLFYLPSQTCHLRVSCRIPPGPGLMDLLVKLRKSRALIQFRGEELQYKESLLSTDAILERCKHGSAFELVLKVCVQSMTTAIDIRIKGICKQSQAISNCPYELAELIRDQEFGNPFSRYNNNIENLKENGHTVINNSRENRGGDEIEAALQRLQSSVRTFR